MRGLDDALASPHPLGALLPGIYADDAFVQRFTRGLDAVLASLLSSLDNLESYLDPDLAPDDFLAWLGSWLALMPEDAESTPSRRRLIRNVPDIYRRRGTAGGLADHIELVFGVRPEIFETGWTSAGSDRAAPGDSGRAFLRVTVRVADPGSFHLAALDSFVAANKPVHVAHSVEVLNAGGSPARPPDGPPTSGPGGRLPEVARSPYRGYGPVRPGDS